MKNRNIIQHKDGKPVYASRFEVAQHIILKNFWEYYLEEADSNGIAFGYVMGIEKEWGSVSPLGANRAPRFCRSASIKVN